MFALLVMLVKAGQGGLHVHDPRRVLFHGDGLHPLQHFARFVQRRGGDQLRAEGREPG